MDWHGAFAPRSIRKHVALPLVTVLVGAALTILAVVACKNYEEAINRSELELNAMTCAEHMKADIANGIGVTNALEEIIISNDGHINRFSTVAEDLMTDVIQSIQIAPGGFVKEIYPANGRYSKLDLALLFVVGMIVVLLIAGFEHVLMVQNDYRERVKHSEELERALVAAQAANAAKTCFLNNMSHDLRTPLNAILGCARLLEQEEGLPAEVDGRLRNIEDSGEHLLSILNNMLDMAGWRAGK